MKKSVFSCVLLVTVFSLLLSGCGQTLVTGTKAPSTASTIGTPSSSTDNASGVPSETTDVSLESITDTTTEGYTLPFDLAKNLILEFDPSEVYSPETAYTFTAKQYIYDYEQLKDIFGLNAPSITVKEEYFNNVYDHYYGESGEFSHAYNILYSSVGDNSEDRIQYGDMSYERYLTNFFTRSLEISSAISYHPDVRRGIIPYAGEKELEGLDLEAVKANFENIINYFDVGENSPIVLEEIYSLSEEDQAEYFVSPKTYHRLRDEHGQALTEIPAEMREELSETYFFWWRQYVNGIPITKNTWSSRFSTGDGKSVSQMITGFENAEGEFSFHPVELICDVEFGESKSIVPFEVVFEKVNSMIGISLSGTQFSILDAELCYCGYQTDKYDIYFHPVWVIVVDEYTQITPYDEPTGPFSSHTNGVFSFDAFTGELIQDVDLTKLK